MARDFPDESLGPRLSEEPYSREDKQLLASAASQAGIALESIRLGEKIAESIEAERRAAQELDFARQVQARLFPQKLPPMKTIEYAAACIPARKVGGDYTIFWSSAPAAWRWCWPTLREKECLAHC